MTELKAIGCGPVALGAVVACVLPRRTVVRQLLASAAVVATGFGAEAARAQGSASASAGLLPALRLGVVPNLSARVIVRNYAPVVGFLEAELRQSVELTTAADFKAFHARALAAEFDAVITAADLARLLELDHKWTHLASYEPAIPGVLVCAKGMSGSGVRALGGKKLAVANPSSMLVTRGIQWLAEQGLKRDTDFELLRARNDDSLGVLLRDPQVPYAMMSMGEFRAIPEATRETLEIHTEFAKLPNFALMASPSLATERVALLRDAFARLSATPAGKAFGELSGVRNIRPSTPRELSALDNILANSRAGMAP